jgi:predicted restriction endonuclease
MILVDPPLQPDNQEVLVDLESLQDEKKRTNVCRVARKDQRKFRDMLLDAFQGKCPITSCDVESALDAAHIFPYRGPLTDFPWNGILLRLDFHRLFDRYLLTIDAQTGRVYLSPSLMNSYREYANTTVRFPEQPVSENRKQALRWHNAQCSWLA